MPTSAFDHASRFVKQNPKNGTEIESAAKTLFAQYKVTTKRTYTPFELEIVELVVWLLHGVDRKTITLRSANRILRASLRRIKPKTIGCSSESKNSSENDLDHAVPFSVIVAKFHDEVGITKERVIDKQVFSEH
jgi:hypothetical protein